MAGSINRVFIIGNLGRDPEQRATPSGTAVSNFSVATTERWKDKRSGEMKEDTEWHRVVLFGPQAELAGRLLAKGAKVCVEGRLKTEKWQDRSGNDRYTTKIIGSSFLMLDGGRSEAPSGARAGTSYDPGQGFDDDIPF